MVWSRWIGKGNVGKLERPVYSREFFARLGSTIDGGLVIDVPTYAAKSRNRRTKEGQERSDLAENDGA